MAEIITDEKFTDGQQNINAANMNGIISRARAQPDLIANKPASATMNIADTLLVLKTDNTLAQTRFDTIVNSTSSALPLADATKNGMLRQVSGLTTDFVDGTNNCQPVTNIIPTGTVWEFLGAIAPAGWLLMQGQAISRTTYSALYALLGTTYGTGDGTTTFNLPDARNRVSVGAGSTYALGARGGSATIALATANLPAHAHSITDQSHIHATVAHTHNDAGHTHGYTQGQGSPTGVQAGGATLYLPGAATTGAGFAQLSAAAPNTDTRFTGINTTNNAGSGTPYAFIPLYLAVNKMVKV